MSILSRVYVYVCVSECVTEMQRYLALAILYLWLSLRAHLPQCYMYLTGIASGLKY